MINLTHERSYDSHLIETTMPKKLSMPSFVSTGMSFLKTCRNRLISPILYWTTIVACGFVLIYLNTLSIEIDDVSINVSQGYDIEVADIVNMPSEALLLLADMTPGELIKYSLELKVISGVYLF